MLHKARRAGAALLHHVRERAQPVPLPVEAPPAPALRYVPGERETLQYEKNTVSPTAHQPLIPREAVQEQLGYDMGALQAVLHLPGAKNPLYCFNQSYVKEGGDPVAQYAFATQQQLDQIRSMRETGSPNWQEIRSGMLVLNNEVQSDGRKHNAQTIGRARWVPGLQQGMRHEHAVPVPHEYAKLAERQTDIHIDDTGTLGIGELSNGKLHTVVEVNPLPAAAHDPWAGQPLFQMPVDGYWQRPQ